MSAEERPHSDHDTTPTRAVASLEGLLLDGRYRLLERIASGGMGSVYRGRHELMKREVAVMVLGNPEVLILKLTSGEIDMQVYELALDDYPVLMESRTKGGTARRTRKCQKGNTWTCECS